MVLPIKAIMHAQYYQRSCIFHHEKRKRSVVIVGWARFKGRVEPNPPKPCQVVTSRKRRPKHVASKARKRNTVEPR